MTLLEALQSDWESRDLLVATRWSSTFIEDVGSAAAENVRSAAVRRWLSQQPVNGRHWLAEVLNKDVIGTDFRVDREFSLTRESRVDLYLSDNTKALAFVEMKWASVPDDDQLARYRSEIDQFARGVPLVLVSPVRHVIGQGRCALSNTYFTDWSQLVRHVHATSTGISIEDDLRRTISRWSSLQDAVRRAVRTPGTPIDELRELVEWLDTEDDNIGAQLCDYPRLARLLIMAEIADAFSASHRDHGWRRCLTNEGAHKDVQADVSPEQLADLWFPCPSAPEVGIAVVLRFHAYPALNSIDVVVGSVILPYLQGKHRESWLRRDPARTAALFQHASQVRHQLAEALRAAGISTSGRPNSQKWWKRTYSLSLGEGRTVGDLHETATRLAEALLGMRAEP